MEEKMFVEITKEALDVFKPYLDKNNYKYEISDVTMNKDSVKHYHIEFSDIKKSQVIDLARELDIAYGLVADNSKTKEKDEFMR